MHKLLIPIGLASALSCAPADAGLPTLFDAPDFVLTDQTGAAFDSAGLEGTVWVASFLFTHCPDMCPLIAGRLAGVRDGLSEAGLLGRDVRLVSITVDPERDTPEVLRRYAAARDAADPRAWAFLTGDPDEVRALVTGGFYVAASRVDGAGDYTIAHSDYLLLVDRAGTVRGVYSALDDDELAQLAVDARRLAR